jgi:hypothetical protein
MCTLVGFCCAFNALICNIICTAAVVNVLIMMLLQVKALLVYMLKCAVDGNRTLQVGADFLPCLVFHKNFGLVQLHGLKSARTRAAVLA